MTRVKLTVGRVREFICFDEKPQSFLWDSVVPGLGIRATANGAKAFIFQSKLDGKTIRVTIGDVRSWAIESTNPLQPGAREEARRLQGMVDRGIDPRQAKADQLAAVEARRVEEARQDVRLEDAWQIYIAARKNRWSERHCQDHIAMLDPGGSPVRRGKKNQRKEPGALAPLRTCRLSELGKEKIRSWLQGQIAVRPTQAALAFRLLRAFLNWCEDTPEYANQAEPGACSGRVAKELPKQKPKTDCLQREQLQAWFKSVKSISSLTVSSYLQILFLIGSRREELAELKWTDVDFKWKAITIHDKVEGERLIPLTPFVELLLKSLKEHQNGQAKKLANSGLNKSDCERDWVFKSPLAQSGRLQDPSNAHRRACSEAGIDSLTLHGLRRSFKSLAEWVEIPVGVVAQIMGHKPSATAEKHYTVRPIDLLRIWHARYEVWLLEQAGINIPEMSVAVQL